MNRFSKSLVLLSVFAVSSSAMAAGITSFSHGYPANNASKAPLPPLAGGQIGLNRIGPTSSWRLTRNGPSETAWFFHRRGETLFERQKFDAAERAFEASLRAQGGTLKEDTLFYLARIAIENGDLEKAENYAERARKFGN